ncbi:MAG: shikimate dehydrogenase [Saprospiraceae bacterium]|nr:shikimate dehydrogenase [Saprospiraceae bacterium]
MKREEVKYLYGLIGYPLSHSFSKGYFAEKFEKEGIQDSYYEAFPIDSIEKLPELIEQNPNLVGLNVTIPYKEQILPYMKELGVGAKAIGAVNTVLIREEGWFGYNSDIYGFSTSLTRAMDKQGLDIGHALILGTGGAAKAVKYALEQAGIKAVYVSRRSGTDILTYDELNQNTLEQYRLIVNTTPLGMSPNVDSFPNIPYHYIGENHLCFDLVYNPKATLFLQKAQRQGAYILNGLEMLHLQAEKSWEIWTTN